MGTTKGIRSYPLCRGSHGETPDPRRRLEGEPEPIPEMLDRLVQEHFRPIKKHAEDTLRSRMEKLQA